MPYASRMPVAKMHLSAPAASLHAEACETGGKLPASAERVAHLVDDALREADREAPSDVRGQPPQDWAAL
ncbi:hypothetical protein G4177_06255 [Corallococcus sp. ZKHCc1 1396]|uniref:Uncharacterized protein n=1 Tax=Corallococcus soli TaxID=2710757 RepID=A0ABR9PIP6_9BACT|nr:hypothetical protein [Corallococcus soli]MBE4747780.1 hypothetical protein [Corallococcus soli]